MTMPMPMPMPNASAYVALTMHDFAYPIPHCIYLMYDLQEEEELEVLQ